MPSLNARWPWEAATLAVAALGALVFQLVLPQLLPDAAQHEEAARWIAREAKPGDMVLLQPWWTERFRLFAPEGVPVVGYLGSDGDDLEDAPRIWVVSQPLLPFAGRAAFDARFLPNREPMGEAQRFGPLRVALFSNGRWTPSAFRASDALETARVAVVSGAGPGEVTTPCARDGQRGFRCPNGLRIDAGWHELRYVPRRCIALDAPGGAKRVVLTFSNVPETRGLVLEAGLIWEHAAKRDPGLTPLVVTLEQSGSAGPPLAALSIPPGLEGLQRAAVAGAGGTLSVTVQSDRAEARHACVELRATGRSGAR